MSHKCKWCIYQMWQSRNDGPCPLASSPLFEHPVNHIVRRGDFLSLPRRSHLPPPPPFRPLACRSPAAAPRRLLRHRRHPIRRIRPYAYAKSFPPSLPPSLPPCFIGRSPSSCSVRAEGYMRTNAYSPPRLANGLVSAAWQAAACVVLRLRRAARSPPHSVFRQRRHFCARCARSVRPSSSSSSSSSTSPSHFPNKDRRRGAARARTAHPLALAPPLPARVCGLCPIFSISMPPTTTPLRRPPPRARPLRVAAWRRQYLNARRKCHTTLGTPPLHREGRGTEGGGGGRRHRQYIAASPPMPRSRQTPLGGRIQPMSAAAVKAAKTAARRRMSFLISDCSSQSADAAHFFLPWSLLLPCENTTICDFKLRMLLPEMSNLEKHT